MNQVKKILVDSNHKVLDISGMFYKEFPSDFRQIRYFTLLVVQKAPLVIKELNLLEQQISEIIKNAVKHGNNCDVNKTLRVWYSFSEEYAHIVVQDEGPGFQDVEKWNSFNETRLDCVVQGDYDRLMEYVSWRTPKSDDTDGGNALFAAVEYWNGGYVFSDAKNTVGALKYFPKAQRLAAQL